jgi:cell division protein FtsB
MKRKNKTTDKRFIIANALMLLAIMYFVYHSLSGERGIVAYFKLKSELQKQTKVLEVLTEERTLLDEKVKNLNPNSLDLDYVDEVARLNLGMIGEGEVVINLDNAPK